MESDFKKFKALSVPITEHEEIINKELERTAKSNAEKYEKFQKVMEVKIKQAIEQKASEA